MAFVKIIFTARPPDSIARRKFWYLVCVIRIELRLHIAKDYLYSYSLVVARV